MTQSSPLQCIADLLLLFLLPLLLLLTPATHHPRQHTATSHTLCLSRIPAIRGCQGPPSSRKWPVDDEIRNLPPQTYRNRRLPPSLCGIYELIYCATCLFQHSRRCSFLGVSCVGQRSREGLVVRAHEWWYQLATPSSMQSLSMHTPILSTNVRLFFPQYNVLPCVSVSFSYVTLAH